MTAPTRPSSSPPFAKGSIIWQRKGPLPVWAWAGLVLLALLIFAWWRRSRSEAAQSETQYTGTEPYYPGDQTPPGVWIVPVSPPPPVNVEVPITVPPPSGPPDTTPPAPPGGGSPPPSQPPGGGTPPSNTPAGGNVTVSKWPDSSVPKESTLWDIAGTWLPEGAANWGLIWNHPLNAATKQKRGQPDRIQQGDVFFVPGKLSSPRSNY